MNACIKRKALTCGSHMGSLSCSALNRKLLESSMFMRSSLCLTGNSRQIINVSIVYAANSGTEVYTIVFRGCTHPSQAILKTCFQFYTFEKVPHGFMRLNCIRVTCRKGRTDCIPNNNMKQSFPRGLSPNHHSDKQLHSQNSGAGQQLH